MLSIAQVFSSKYLPSHLVHVPVLCIVIMYPQMPVLTFPSGTSKASRPGRKGCLQLPGFGADPCQNVEMPDWIENTSLSFQQLPSPQVMVEHLIFDISL